MHKGTLRYIIYIYITLRRVSPPLRRLWETLPQPLSAYSVGSYCKILQIERREVGRVLPTEDGEGGLTLLRDIYSFMMTNIEK